MTRLISLSLSLTLALACSAAACAAYSPDEPVSGHRDIDKVNGGITLPAGSTVGDISTVNGGISLGSNSRADKVENVNGGIDFGDSVSVESIEGVNGGIQAGKDLHVQRGIETVNGGVQLGAGAVIGGDLITVSGGIELDHAQVAGSIEMTAGSIDTGRGSHIGSIKVDRTNGVGNGRKQKLPRVIVGPDSVVSGDIVLERETELYVHQSARIGAVRGGSAQRYSGDRPELPN
jgi:hypothetical protein